MEKSLEGLGSRIPNLKHSTLSNVSLEKTLLKNKSQNRVLNTLNHNKNIFSYYKVKNSFLRPDVKKMFNIEKKIQRKKIDFSFNNFINNNNNEINPFVSSRINTYSNPNRNNINYLYKELKEDEEFVKKIKEKKKFFNKLKPNNKNFLIKEYIKCLSPSKIINDNFYNYQNGFKSNKKFFSKNSFNKTIGNRNNLNIIYKNNNLFSNTNNFEKFFDNNNNKRNFINKRFPKNEIEKFSNGFLTSSYVKKD